MGGIKPASNRLVNEEVVPELRVKRNPVGIQERPGRNSEPGIDLEPHEILRRRNFSFRKRTGKKRTDLVVFFVGNVHMVSGGSGKWVFGRAHREGVYHTPFAHSKPI